MNAEDATMDHAEVAAGRVVDRYLRGSLDAEEAQRFERHFLACQECLDELETTEELVDGLRAAAAEDVARTAVGLGLAAGLARLGRLRRLAFYAACAALLILPSAFLYSRLGTVGSELDATRSALAAARAPQAALAVLPLNPLRGDDAQAAAREIRLGERPGWVVLALELDRPSHPRYRVTLRDAAGAELWTSAELVPDARDVLTLNVHSATLAAGDHAVDVAGLDPGGAVPVATFRFRVVAD